MDYLKINKEDQKKDHEESLLSVPSPNPMVSSDSWFSWKTRDKQNNYSNCICCRVAWSNKKTQKQKCCLCLPLRAGVIIIAVISIIISLFQILLQILWILNDQIDWYLPVVNIILLMPLLVGSSMFFRWLFKDTRSSRLQLISACDFIKISIFLYNLWCLLYFSFIYSGNTVQFAFGSKETVLLR